MTAGVVALAVALVLIPIQVFPQSASISLDLGASRMRYADSVDATAMSFTPDILVRSSRAVFAASGNFSQLAGSWSNSGIASGTLIGRVARLISAEIEGMAGGSLHADGGRTGQFLGSARLRVERGSRGLWLGGGAGKTWDGLWRDMLQGDAGGWLAWSKGSAMLSVTPTSVADSIRYTDASVALRRQIAAWEFEASVGHRIGRGLPALLPDRNTWGSVGGTFWLSSSVGVVASAGAYPVDFTQGYPGGRFLSLSLRFAPRRASPATATGASVPRSDVRDIDVGRVSGDLHRVRIFAPSARSVEITGDFTLWTATALQPEVGGWWSAALPIRRGMHEMNMRVDRGSWRVPPGLISTTDEFGSASGRLMIP